MKKEGKKMILRLFSLKDSSDRTQFFSDQLFICVLLLVWGLGISNYDVFTIRSNNYVITALNMAVSIFVLLLFFVLMFLYFMNVFRRVRDIFGKCYPPLWIVLHLVPGINILLAMFLYFTPSKKDLPSWVKF